MSRVALSTLVAAAGLIAFGTLPAFASNYYVSNACTYNGSGSAPSCATANGQEGAIKDLQAFLNAKIFQPGDTVFIRTGSTEYVTTGSPGIDGAGFHISGSGTPGNPITIRNYPGETPTLTNCPSGSTSQAVCDSATLTSEDSSYLRVSGLRIRGALIFRMRASSIAQLHPGIVIDHNEVEQGWSYAGDGNWAGIRLEYVVGAWVHHNYIHDLARFVDSGFQSSPACIKIFTGPNSIYEFNTCATNQVDAGLLAFDDKQDSVNNIWRYNRATAVSAGIRLGAQGRFYASSTGTQVYGNIFVQAGAPQNWACQSLDNPNIQDESFFNNTCVGFRYGLTISDSSVNTVTATLRFYNNLVPGVTVQNVNWYSRGPILDDYNAYSSGYSWRYGSSTYPTLASVVAGTTYGAHSLALSTLAAFGFVNAGTGDYQLAAGSVCRGSGRMGGVSSGAVVDLGAHFNGLTCVGHLCPPAPPSGLRIIR